MRTPLTRTPEWSPLPALQDPMPHPLLLAATLLVHEKSPHHALGVSEALCTLWANTPQVQDAQATLERAVRKRVIDHADADAVTIAKAEAPIAMRRIIGLASSAPDAKTQLHANAKVLDLAGVVPPKARTIPTTQDLIDAMTAEELEHFIQTDEYPARFGDHLRRLALRRQLVTHGTLTVEAEVVEEDEQTLTPNGTPHTP